MKIGQKLLMIWEKFDDVIGIAAIAKVVGEKALEKVRKKVEEKFGLGTLEQAGKDVTDEILYNIALAALDNDAKEMEIGLFETKLRDVEPKKAEAFVLFIAKMVSMFEREVKEIASPGKDKDGKEKGGKRTEQSYRDLEKGIGYAKRFLCVFLQIRDPNGDAKETYRLRVAFLQGKNVFSLVKSPKEKDWIEKLIENAIAFSGEALKSIHENVCSKANGLGAGAQSYKEGAKARYMAAKKGG